ncbi:MAG: glycosyltransferase family 2 protein [Candidatus Margulisbacteria bacterium]|nr:glycosyltransferase family 2 protein [Candidatus Margulisiibacteriota bacterium]
MKKLSILIPAYNEEGTLGELLSILDKLSLESAGFKTEIIVVNDGSTDRTEEIAKQFPDVLYIYQDNQGKGAAVKTGIERATGDWVLIQDADLEYDPHDYIDLLSAITQEKQVVYGSRFLGQLSGQKRNHFFPGKHPDQRLGPWIAGLILSFWTFLLYGRWITDTLTAYKLFPSSFIKRIEIETTGFETDHELSSKLIRLGYRIEEVPIRYHPRSLEEGKKIKAKDGFIAVWTLLKFRFNKAPVLC